MKVEVLKFGNGKVRLEVTISAAEAKKDLKGCKNWQHEALCIASEVAVSPRRWVKPPRGRQR
jgi:hypothetical protein